MKKLFALSMLSVLLAGSFTGCSSGDNQEAGSINYTPNTREASVSASADEMSPSPSETSVSDINLESEVGVQFKQKLDELSSSANDYLLMHSTERAEKLVNPSLNGNTKGVGLIQALALGAEPNIQHFYSDSGSFKILLTAEGKDVMAVSGYFIPESQQINVNSLETFDGYKELLNNNMDQVSTWATS